MGRGYYIVFEGIDGAGTTTHARLLYSKLSSLGVCVEYVEEPSKGPIGGLIRHLLQQGPFKQHLMTLLFAADRVLQYETRVRRLLDSGCIIVSDRSWVSSLAYQSCEVFSDSVDMEWIYIVNRYAPKPDIVVYIDVDPLIAFKRLLARGRVLEKPEHLRALRELHCNYKRIMGIVEKLVEAVIYIDATPGGVVRSVESVSREITVKTLAAINYLSFKDPRRARLPWLEEDSRKTAHAS